MNRLLTTLLCLVVLVTASDLHAAQAWKLGEHYVLLAPAQRTTVPADKVEVLQVFSYGCVACNSFRPIEERLKSSLPPNAKMAFLHASFNPAESWPMFQRAYITAQTLGIAERTHEAMYDAIWKTGELAVVDRDTQRLKKPQPTLEDAARCYERLTGVKRDVFLSTARSFAVETKMRAADTQVAAMQVDGTPCIVVNGKYRVELDSLRSVDELVELVQYLVARESRR